MNSVELDIMKRFVIPGDVLLDVGAHWGTFTHLAINHGIARAICVEPELSNLKFLTQFAKAYSCFVDIIVHSCAVGSENGETQLQLCEHSLGHSTNKRCRRHFAHLFNGSWQPVVVKTLDTLLEKEDTLPTVWKLDAEGSEAEILQGAKCLLREHPPRAILAEWRFDLEELANLLPDYTITKFMYEEYPLPPTYLFKLRRR